MPRWPWDSITRKRHASTAEAVEKQSCKSVLLMSDASPKGKLDDSKLNLTRGWNLLSFVRRRISE